MARYLASESWRRDGDHAAPWMRSIEPGVPAGTPGDDRTHGDRFDNTIEGLGGDDVLGGRGGSDGLSGGDGDDVLRGGVERQEHGSRGSDMLNGGAGDDRLYGGFGGDSLFGGSGRDRFMYTELTDTTLEHSDTIIDFAQGRDKLVFRAEFRAAGGLHFIGDATFSHTPGEVRFSADADSSIVEIDLNGDALTDSRIIFATGIQFQASDFSF